MKFILKFINKFERGMDKNYVSDADKALQDFDQKNPKRSSSQRREIEKHRNIFNRERDSRIDWNWLPNTYSDKVRIAYLVSSPAWLGILVGFAKIPVSAGMTIILAGMTIFELA